MRQGELDRLLVSHLRLTDNDPAVFVAPKHDARNKRGMWLPLLPWHVAELAAWVKDTGKADGDLLFCVPEKPNKIFRRDLMAAGIDYRDREGRYFDFHALRHCTDTFLNANGVPPTVVILFMRHKKPSLSLVTYNDPRMTDARKALDALPKLG
jgi:integrase